MGREKSGFHYLGIGCLVVAVLALVAGGILAFAVHRFSQRVEADAADPRARERGVLETLRGESLPPGYHANLALRVPWLLELAMLGDEPTALDEGRPELGERGLLYLAFRNFGRDRDQLDDFFAGHTSDPAALDRHDINVDVGERVGQGRIERPGGPIRWVAHEGELGGLQTRGRHDGLMTLFQVVCPEDSYNRIGILFGPRADSGGDLPVELTGTVADPAVVGDFVAHFDFCPR